MAKMTTRKIRWLVGVMILALAGVIYLQVYAIRRGIKLNAQRFDKNVLAALSAVSSGMELNETKDALLVINGYAAAELEKSGAPDPGVLDLLQEKVANGGKLPRRVGRDIARELGRLPVAERVRAVRLKAFLEKELKNRGITIPYHYGVFDLDKQGFVLYDGHYLVNTGGLQGQKRFRQLLESPYNVILFPQDTHPKGKLYVSFPQKKKYIRAGLTLFALASFLFSGIIVAVFAYTIYVISRQKKISEMKSDFMNNMTHEFKTPIATISLAAESIVNPAVLADPAKIKRFVNIIRQENKRMHRQVEQVLNSARWENKDVKIQTEVADLHEILRRAIENIKLQVEKKSGTIEAHFGAQPAELHLDPVHVSNIFHNLLDNANKYCFDKPKIVVRTRNVKGGIEVLISDNGIGISRADQKHIFEKFYRVHTGNRHDVKGFGLGLAYVKLIVELHGGHIRVDSEPGKGSRFTIFFPRKPGTS